jgi:hypothetical protein
MMILVLSAATAAAQTHSGHKELEARGSRTMGFDQAKAAHHFRLSPSGGSIEVHVKTLDDYETRSRIVAHLRQIAQQFKGGDFGVPVATHAEHPDGVTELRRLRELISYTFEATEHGGRVRITTGDRDALKALHEFLRYQIREHKTGDPLTVGSDGLR